MKKNVWLINHYATNMYEQSAGRHYYFGKYLLEAGYNPVIICSSFVHKGEINYIQDRKKYLIENKDGITFVFIKTSSYVGNGRKRIVNMIEFTKGVIQNGKAIAKELGKPDVVLGSSVHPLSCVAAIFLGKGFKSKIVSEIRDLWPETLVMFGTIKEHGLFTSLLYAGEKWIYKKSDDIIFTMEGGKQYILDRGWNKCIAEDKIHYINNGIDIEQFDMWKVKEAFADKDLDEDTFKVIYTGTISQANGVKRVIDAAQLLKEKGNDTVKILIYGQGEDKEQLEKYCKEKKIDNVIFKGQVKKKKIPYILSKGDLLLVNYSEDIIKNKHNVLRYGGSHNKLFEYLAAGKPILYAQPGCFNIVEKASCGKVLQDATSASVLMDGILFFENLQSDKYEELCHNSRLAALNFDSEELTKELIKVLER